MQHFEMVVAAEIPLPAPFAIFFKLFLRLHFSPDACARLFYAEGAKSIADLLKTGRRGFDQLPLGTEWGIIDPSLFELHPAGSSRHLPCQKARYFWWKT